MSKKNRDKRKHKHNHEHGKSESKWCDEPAAASFDLFWIRRMVEEEEKRGPLLPNGFGCGVQHRETAGGPDSDVD